VVSRPGIAADRLHDTWFNIKQGLGVIALANENDLKVSDTTSIRLNVWKGGLRAFTSSPKTILVGNGPETFAYSFLPHRPEELNLTSEWDFLFNKAHNDFLDKVVSLGILGLASYLLLIGTFFKWTKTKLLNHSITQSLNKNNVLLVGLGSGLVGLLVTDIFGWQTVTTNLYFWLFIAIAIAIERKAQKPKSKAEHKFTTLKAIQIMVLFIFTFYFLLFTFRLYQADVLYDRGDIESMEKAVKLNPREATYQRELTRALALANQEDKFLEHANLAYNLNPNNMLTIKSLIGSYSHMATHNSDYLASAIDLAHYGSELSPNDAKLKFTLANLYYIIGNDENTREYILQALELKPDYQEVIGLGIKLKKQK